MELKVVSIHNQGNSTEEYVWLEVLNNCNLNNYIVCDTTYAGQNAISNRLRHMYWFASKEVKKGERVVLRTGKGTDKTFDHQQGYKVHRFHWGLASAVWNNTGDAAVLLKLDAWKTTKAK